METMSASDADALARATAALDAGELVVVPADLQYVLVADALDDDALARLLAATARGADRGLPVAIGGHEDLHHVAYATGATRDLADAHWPGAALLHLRARLWLPDALTAGTETVAVTVPERPFARALARNFGPYALVALGATPEEARARAPADARLLVDDGPLPGGEAKTIRGGTSAAP